MTSLMVRSHFKLVDKYTNLLINESDIDDSINLQYMNQLREKLGERCPRLDYSKFLPQIESSDIEESLEWFVNSSEYRVWKQAHSSKLLIHGQRGDGKTVVMSYVLKCLDLEHQFGRQRDVASIFCSSMNSELEMVSSLVCQLLPKNNIRTTVARQIFPIPKLEQGVHLSNLWNLLKSIIETTEHEIILLIDGIDKLDERVRSSFLRNFHQIGPEVDGTKIPMRVLISSETRGDIMEEFAHYSTIDRENERRGKSFIIIRLKQIKKE